VITGGGAELLGAAELASHIFRLPVRVGKPRLSGGLVEECKGSAFSTAVGLVLEGFDREGIPVSGTDSHPREKSGEPVIGKLIDWLKKEFF
jgi:cell division protein FtsA